MSLIPHKSRKMGFWMPTVVLWKAIDFLKDGQKLFGSHNAISFCKPRSERANRNSIMHKLVDTFGPIAGQKAGSELFGGIYLMANFTNSSYWQVSKHPNSRNIS